MKRYLVPVIAGVTVFGAATAFAASMTINTEKLGSGNGLVEACNASAKVIWSSTGMGYNVTPRGYEVGDVNIESALACKGLSFKITLTGAGDAVLGTEKTGTLLATVGNEGKATVSFGADNIEAKLVTGASLVIYGTPPA